MHKLPVLTHANLPPKVPKRRQKLAPKIAKWFNKVTKWQVIGSLPNVEQAVVIGVPHTSNIDGVYALPLLIELGIDVRILGKKELFFVPVLAQFLKFAGVMPIDRDKKGSVLQANIERFATKKPLFLGLSPEGTRWRTERWRTGFYYLALGAGVPIIPAALDYRTKTLQFLPPFYPTGDIEQDLPKIYAYFDGITPKHPEYFVLPTH